MTAIQTAALIPWDRRTDTDLGRIVLTESGRWSKPDPQDLFLPIESGVGDGMTDPECTVHPNLAADEETLSALRELGLKPPSPESRFTAIANRLLVEPGSTHADHDLLEEFWSASRDLRSVDAFAIVSEHDHWRRDLRVRTRADDWKPLHSVLMPGVIVPGDGSPDDGATVDSKFHAPDQELLSALGVADAPFVGRDLRWEPLFAWYQNELEQQYRSRDDLPATPQTSYVAFTSYEKVGPLEVLCHLSAEANVAYTDALLSLDACFERWVMWHTGSNREKYPKMTCESLPIWLLSGYGQVRTPAGIVPLKDALGLQPASQEALHALLRHPNAERIKHAFDLSDPIPDLFGEGDPVPLTDIWPGLREYLPAHQRNARLVPCERIFVAGEEHKHASRDSNVYLVGSVDDDERGALERVVGALDLDLGHGVMEKILRRRTPAEIEKKRAAIRQCSTDAERLLRAVGEQHLRTGLPRSLLDVLEDGHERLTAVEIAEAVIATHHTDALRQFKWALDHLGPPARWSGSQRAVTFVRALGFSEEWAGERKSSRPPFMEVEGPRTLPPLHNYQRVIAANVREMLHSDGGGGVERRGMVSMPTGSGKTRVAVQARRRSDARRRIQWRRALGRRS